MSMTVNLKTTQALIAKVEKDIDDFHQKRAGQSVWLNIYDVYHNKAIDDSVRKFAHSLPHAPYSGSAKVMMDYYTEAFNLIKRAGINPEHVSFESGPEGVDISLFVTPANTMTEADYYKEVVFNKGQLISFEKENQRGLDKVKQTHADYTKDLDEEVKKKLDEVLLAKTQPFKDIDTLLQKAISLVTAEEMKYKPVKQLKMK